MIVLTQLAWSPADAAALAPSLRAALRIAEARDGRDESCLILLPIATLDSGVPTGESELATSMASLAASVRAYVAGAARVRRDDARTAMRGFVFGPDGRCHLWLSKCTPSLVLGFDDCAVESACPAEFQVAGLPIGQVGMLIGEDIHFATHARSLAFHGAELILNPSEECLDDDIALRAASRLGRAAENSACVATASATIRRMDGVDVGVPSATAFYSMAGRIVAARANEDFVFPDFDLQALRRARVNPHRSMPAIVRANVYARGYARAAATVGSLPSPAPQSVDEWRHEARRRFDRLYPASAGASNPAVAAVPAAAGVPAGVAPGLEDQYEALLVQHCARLIPLDRSVDAPALMQRNLDEALELAGSRANVPSVRLCVFPEFWLTGPGGIGGVQRTVADMQRLAIRYPGPVFDRISEFAQRHRVWMAFQNFEVHDRLPHRVFNSAFLIDDSGTLVHTYRKNQCADVWGLLPDTTPGSILSQYLDTFGDAALFPVAQTPLGRIANMICFDNMIPEVAHGLRQAGAEVILHSSSEPHGGAGREVWDTCRQLRAFENTCYVLSAIDGGEHLTHDSDHYTFFRRGHSRIVRFDGVVEGTVDGPGPVAFRVGVDLAALRRARANPRRNFALWDDAGLYAAHYAAEVGLPNDLWAGDPLTNPYAGASALRACISRYLERGIYVAPGQARARMSLPDSV
jgi:predicted amidohydrolase